MKHRYSYLVALILIVDSRLAIGSTAEKTTGESRASSQFDDDRQEKKLRKLLESSDLASVSHLFQKSKKRIISRGEMGQLRIFVGDVNDQLLKTNIDRVSFGPTERYNAIDAIIAVTQTKVIQAKLGKLGMEQPLTAYPGYRQIPDQRVPHLPGTIRNVTLEQALDQVAETFDCLIIYAGWTIDGSRLFDVDCAEGADFKGLGQRRRRR